MVHRCHLVGEAHGRRLRHEPSTFAPDDPITRAQLAVILYNYTKQFAPESLTETGSLTGFPDADSVRRGRARRWRGPSATV